MVGIGWCLQSPVYAVWLDDFDVTGDDMVEFLLCWAVIRDPGPSMDIKSLETRPWNDETMWAAEG